jgi:hypothetical protein
LDLSSHLYIGYLCILNFCKLELKGGTKVVIQSINLALRFILELCVLASVFYWGLITGKGLPSKLFLGIGVPLVIAFVWGTFGAPKAVWVLTGWTRLLLEVVVFGSGVMALFMVGRHSLAILFGVVIIVNRVLMYIWNQ